MYPTVKAAVRSMILGALVLQAAPAAAQSELQLRQAFEGQYVFVRMEMPATHKGVDLYTGREPAVDFQAYSARLREFGVALRQGDRVLVTAVRVKDKNIEFHLGGGGYGVWGDDTGSVYVPTASKSRRERDLEKDIKDERNPDRRRRMQRELDNLRSDRHRENRDRDSERRALEADKKSEVADKRLDAGSRVNVWIPEAQLDAAVPTPAQLRRMLSPVIDFGDADVRRPSPAAQDTRKLPPPDRGVERADGNGGGDIRRGMSVDEVHDQFGKPTRFKAGKQGELATLTEWYEDNDRVTEVVFVAGVVVRFSTSSK